jgi:hypothetical protein
MSHHPSKDKLIVIEHKLQALEQEVARVRSVSVESPLITQIGSIETYIRSIRAVLLVMGLPTEAAPE